jgi:hypothetical protein
MIERSKLTQTNGIAMFTESWIDALAIIAWRFFCHYRGSMRQETIRKEIKEITAKWEEAITNNFEQPSNLSIQNGFKLLEDPALLNASLTRTIFIPLGGDAVRFSHRQWEEFLISRYVAHCIRCNNYSELVYRGLTKEAYASAAEDLDNDELQVQITEDTIRRVEEVALSYPGLIDQTLTFGNFSGIFVNSILPVTAGAMKYLSEQVLKTSYLPVVRVIIVSGLGNRVLRNSPRDTTITVVRNEMIQLFQNLLPSQPDYRDGVLRSFSWCFQKALSVKFPRKISPPAQPWPGLDNRHVDGILDLICSKREDGTYRPNPLHISTQIFGATFSLQVGHRAELEIGAMHWLYPVVNALRLGATTPDVNAILKAVFAKSTGLARRIKSYTAVPELYEIYKYCELMYKEHI